MQLTGFTAKWAEGSRHKTDANVAYMVTKDLEDRGMLTAQNLVEVSRPEDAPLHDEFEWDDSVAAEEYRKTQARGIIRSIQIIRDDSEKAEKVYANVRIERPEYTTIVKALTIPDERELLLKAARRDMLAFRAKYVWLKELDGVLNAINLYIDGDKEAKEETLQNNGDVVSA